VNLAKSVNKKKREFRTTRFLGDYYNFLDSRKIYPEEKIKYEHQKAEKKIKKMEGV